MSSSGFTCNVVLLLNDYVNVEYSTVEAEDCLRGIAKIVAHMEFEFDQEARCVAFILARKAPESYSLLQDFRKGGRASDVSANFVAKIGGVGDLMAKLACRAGETDPRQLLLSLWFLASLLSHGRSHLHDTAGEVGDQIMRALTNSERNPWLRLHLFSIGLLRRSDAVSPLPVDPPRISRNSLDASTLDRRYKFRARWHETRHAIDGGGEQVQKVVSDHRLLKMALHRDMPRSNLALLTVARDESWMRRSDIVARAARMASDEMVLPSPSTDVLTLGESIVAMVRERQLEGHMLRWLGWELKAEVIERAFHTSTARARTIVRHMKPRKEIFQVSAAILDGLSDFSGCETLEPDELLATTIAVAEELLMGRDRRHEKPNAQTTRKLVNVGIALERAVWLRRTVLKNLSCELTDLSLSSKEISLCWGWLAYARQVFT
jgi:hypothetical protein